MISAFVILGYSYTISIQPMKRSEKHGDKAWTDCKKFRLIGGIAELISLVNLILWIWFPLPVVNEWIISSNIWIGIIIGICMLVPCIPDLGYPKTAILMPFYARKYKLSFRWVLNQMQFLYDDYLCYWFQNVSPYHS